MKTYMLKCDRCGAATEKGFAGEQCPMRPVCEGHLQVEYMQTQPTEPMSLSNDSQARKDMPITTGVLDYFPNAFAALAKLAKAGNDKHNPGQPLHWARGKSQDHADCIARHLIDRGRIDPDDGISHTVKLAWRALALVQLEEEAKGAPVSRGAQECSKPVAPLDEIIVHSQGGSGWRIRVRNDVVEVNTLANGPKSEDGFVPARKWTAYVRKGDHATVREFIAAHNVKDPAA